MGKSMAQSLGFNLVIAVMVAYVATLALTTTSSAMDVFRLTSTVGFLCYAAALGWGPIWWSRSWESTFKEMVDGLVYGCVLGAVFLWMW